MKVVYENSNQKKQPEKSHGHKPYDPQASSRLGEVMRDPREYSEVLRNEPQTTNPLAAFMVRPSGMRFETQEQMEDILMLLRRHPITNLKWILIAIVMLLAPLILEFVPILAFLPLRFQVISVVGWYLLTTGFVLEQFLNWYFNVYLITDERVIDFDFSSLAYKRVSETKIEKIEDVTFEMTGVLRSVLNFGTVFIQTAGEKREFDFEDVPQPQKVVKFLNEMMIEEEREQIEGRVR